MRTDCLFIIDDNSPLNFALEMLFGPASGINAVRSQAVDFQGLVNEVCSLQSPVVLVEDSADANERSPLAQLVMSNPQFKIIVILRDSNYIHIFRKEEVMIESSSELIKAIRSA